LLRLEAIARSERLGLWAAGNAIPPWEWRRGRRSPADAIKTSSRAWQ
jgi:endonuclease YncB( thermonuclease family)